MAKFDINWQRIALVTVASNDAPTNDMLPVGDETLVNAGKFLPGQGHRIYNYDEDLNFLSTKEIGGGENRHSNGAASVFWNGNYHIVAPSTLALLPMKGGRFIRRSMTTGGTSCPTPWSLTVSFTDPTRWSSWTNCFLAMMV